MADAAAAESRADAEADDFEFCILSSGGIVPAGKNAGTDMCVADELFCQGKLLPLRASSAADGASVATLPRSESAASTVGLVSRSGSRSASSSSSGSSSVCVSRSQSSKSASSDQGVSGAAPAAAAAQPRRSLSSSVFYAHPSPSPQLRSARPRRSTGSAALQPASAWGLFRLGVVGAPDVYPPPPRAPAADAKVAARGGGGSRSARFEQVATAVDRKLGIAAVFGDGLGCRCSPDAIEPVRTLEAAKRRRKKDGTKGVVRRSRILDWLEELSIGKEKK